MHLLTAPLALSVLSYALALPPSTKPQPLPLLIWHGLGDRYDAEGLHSVGDLAEEVHPGTYIYYIRMNDDGGEDRSSTFLGNLTEQMSFVCEALHDNSKLKDSKTGELRVDALGFSQGGQFLRGLLQRCDGLSMRSLVTFGSQHNGIADIKACGTWDYICKGALALMRSNAYSDYAQCHVVPAQYYRTVNESTGLASDGYLEHSNFLADVNNERKVKNETYSARLASLEKLVMYVFENDTTVIPKESGWFAEVNGTSGEVTPLRERKMYKEDWVGLKKLDQKGGLVFRSTPGDHMRLDEDILRGTFEDFFGPDNKDGELVGAAKSWWRFWQQTPDPIIPSRPKEFL